MASPRHNHLAKSVETREEINSTLTFRGHYCREMLMRYGNDSAENGRYPLKPCY